MINKISMILQEIMDLPVTLYFNFYYLPFRQAIKLPMAISHKIKIAKMGKKGAIKVDRSEFRSIKVGKNGSFNLGENEKVYWDIGSNANIEFKGIADIGKATKIICGNQASIVFGNNFCCNANCIINSSGNIKFGEEALIGWRTEFLTTGGHKIYQLNEEKTRNLENGIIIGKHVWIASNVTILGGGTIGDYSVVATKACINKSFEQCNILIGNFNKILKENIDWKK